jgi:hypothetical protein
MNLISVGLSVSRVELMTRFLSGLPCAADDQIFVWWGWWPDFCFFLSCGADDQNLFGQSCGAGAQIFVWSVLWDWWPDFCLVCLVRLMTRFIFARPILSCGADDQICVWSVLWGWCPDFCLVSLVRLMTRFLSGQSCPVAMKTRFLSGLPGGADTQIFVWSVLCGWWSDFCPISLVLCQW